MGAMLGDRRAHCIRFSLETHVIDACAAADPVLGRAAVKRMINGGGGRRIADAHLAQDEKVRL